MPYALKYEEVPARPTKRRKVSTIERMAAFEDAGSEDKDNSQRARETDVGDESQFVDSPQLNDTPEITTSDREKLIECIKRGQRPKWVPKPSLKALCDEETALQEPDTRPQDYDSYPNSAWPARHELDELLFFGPWFDSSRPAQPAARQTRSAYHTGTFQDIGTLTEPASSSSAEVLVANETLVNQRNSVSSCLYTTDPPTPQRSASDPQALRGMAIASIDTTRQPAASISSSRASSYVMRTPTSPLVHAVSQSSQGIYADDLPPATGPSHRSRRRTMPPSFLPPSHGDTFDTVTTASPLQITPQPSSLHQRHQPRRSLSSFTYQSTSNSIPSQPRTHRPSLSFDQSRRRTSLVGSFEESILRGRMSSPASKPFDFVAQIGVMGKGNCPAILRCPAHVIIPFQAVFYSYPTSSLSRSISDDTPSPYVGLIDLEHNLKPVHLGKRTSLATSVLPMPLHADPRAPENTPIGRAIAHEAAKRTEALAAPIISIGGVYRVPQQGQLQIVIKNSDKSAVKLFLVPYDLEGMTPSTKTFVRQRSYMTGPIMDGTPAGSHSDVSLLDPLKDKRILRYLIHVKFCCPAKGRYYLHDNIRVVFANRVPDGKEKLQNELQLPEPKYSSYRPAKPPSKTIDSSAVEAFATDATTPVSPTQFDDTSFPNSPVVTGILEKPSTESTGIPFHLPRKSVGKEFSRAAEISKSPSRIFLFPGPPMRNKEQEPQRALSPVQGFLPSTSARSSPISWGSTGTPTVRSFSPTPVEAGNGLLSRQFRQLNELADSNDQSTSR